MEIENKDDDIEISLSSIFDESSLSYKREITNITDDDVRKQFTSSAIMEELYNLMNCVHEIFSHHNITYWLCGGSLLGACRHSGIIPWDDDLDICCLLEQREQIYELENIFLKNNYLFEINVISKRSNFSMQIYKKGSVICNNNGEVPYPFLDIFFMSEDAESEFGKSVIHYASAMHRVLYLKHYFTLQELFPLKLTKFGPINKIFVPNNSISHISRAYGAAWNEEGQLHIYDHVTKNYIGGPIRTFPLKPFMNVNLLQPGFKLEKVIL